MRPIAWRGSEEIGVAAQLTSIHLAIAVWEWGAYFGVEQRMKGVRLCMAPWRRPHPSTAPTASKATGLYMIGTMSKHAAMDQGYADALMLQDRLVPLHKALFLENNPGGVLESGVDVADAFLDRGEIVSERGRAKGDSLVAWMDSVLDRVRSASGVDITHVPYKGSSGARTDIVGGLRSGLTYAGSKTIKELQRKLNYVTITPSGWHEGTPHKASR